MQMDFFRERNGLRRHMSYHLIDLVQQLGHPRLLVIGDVILDKYTWGNAERISQEAPVILLREDRQEVRLGGAANVANMLRGLEAEVTMVGVVGDDDDGRLLKSHLEAIDVDFSLLLTDPDRPTSRKERLIGRAQNRHPHQMLRVDRESRQPIDDAMADKLLAAIEQIIDQHQAILVSDYAKGVCTPDLLTGVIDLARARGIPVIVDPSNGDDYTKYRRATAITPNRLETQLATNHEIKTPDDAFTAGQELCKRLCLDHVFVTLDSDGIATVTADGTAELLPTRKRQVYDITGAGDMVLAMIGLGAAEGVSPTNLARLANVAGGLEVEQIGVVNISREEILNDILLGSRTTAAKFCTLEQLHRHVEARRRNGQRIVLTNGCFDVLHVGHVSYLEQAAQEGDCLVVAINSDESVRLLNKGPDRPVFAQNVRGQMLAALEAVDYVIVFEESTPHNIIERLKPDLLVKGGTYETDEIVGRELVGSYGGEVKVLGVVPGISSTEILKSIRGDAGVLSNDSSHDHPIRKAG